MTRHPLFTTGYAGFDSTNFLWKLRLDNVEVVIDVRDNPFSRNRAFSQVALKRHLEQNGVEYIHMQQFGVPGSLRQSLRAGGNLNEYFEAYREYLQGAESTVWAIVPKLLDKRCCFLCLEKNPFECHRSVLAEWIANLQEDTFEVKHI